MSVPTLDREVCTRAYKARDTRFDGRFFIGVKTTGVFCRPVCPAPSPKSENVDFFPSAAAAATAGFRPCLRCRPETSPGTPAWEGTSATVSRALRLIEEGVLDEENVETLAARFGITPRQLSRLFSQHLGASPVAVAQTRRLLFAKKLIDESGLSMTDIAFAAGFGSIRRFNAVFSKVYGRPPSSLRKQTTRPDVSLNLPYRPPYDWPSMLQFFRQRQIAGLERVDEDSYYRSLNIDGCKLQVRIQHAPAQNALRMTLLQGETRLLMKLVERVRRVFDLGADISTINTQLMKDELLKPAITARPGLRLPGGWSLFEIIVRAILGQQVSVAAAHTLAGRLVRLCGEPAGEFPDGSEAFVFPEPQNVAEANLTGLGLTRKRAETLSTVAAEIASGRVCLENLVDADSLTRELEILPGIGPWTSQYVAMRGLSEPDAFPVADLGLLKATGLGSRQLETHAEQWRPWRAYAAIHLWNTL